MDPLSIIASAITLIGAVDGILKSIDQLRSLVRAREAINALIEDVHALRALLQDVEEAQDLLKDVARKPAFCSYLMQAKVKIEELDGIIRIRLLGHSTGEHPTSTHIRLQWLRSQAKVKALQADLRYINGSITTCLAASIFSGQLRLQNSVQEISMIMSQIRTAADGRQRSELDGMLSRFLITDLQDDLSQLPHQSQRCENVDFEHEREDSSSMSPFTTPRAENVLEICQTDSVIEKSIAPDNSSNVFGRCRDSCPCSCHSKQYFTVAQLLSYLTGSFCVRYTGGQPTRACDQSSCIRKLSATVNLTYYFPRWLLSKAINVFLDFDNTGSIHMTMEIPRVRPDTDRIFHLAAAGDTGGMKTLFERGFASPNDVSDTFGYSVLHVAVDMEHVEAVRFLLSQGANPYLTNRLNLTAVDLAWNRILSKRTDDSKSQKLSSLFGTTSQADQIEKRRLSRLQQIVLGLIDVNLNLALIEGPLSEINEKDADGNTVLAWAAQCGNDNATRSLLHRGIDYNNISRFGSSALHYAASARTPTCILPILEAGADANTRNTRLYETPLHVAALRHDEPESFMAPLISYGADINACDYEGSSVLAFAAQSNNFRSAEYLLDQGAKIDSPDNSGLTPIGVAITYNHHAMLAMLLAHGANVEQLTHSGETLLHLCAQHGDLDTLAVLAESDLKMISDILDERGMSASAYAQLRDEEELTRAFQRLIAKLK